MIKLLFDCPENIKSHPQTKAGHFCKSCQKEIIDFSYYTAEEIKNHFRNFQGTTCGTFKSNQIESPLESALSSLFRFAFGLVFLLGLNSSQLMAQETQTVGRTTPPVSNNQLVITGQITSGDEPLPFVKVTLYSGQTQLEIGLTDVDGNYKISVSDSLLHTDLRIEFKFVGYNIHEVLFNPEGLSTILINQDLTEYESIMNTGCIIYEPNILVRDPSDFGKTTISGDDLKYRQR